MEGSTATWVTLIGAFITATIALVAVIIQNIQKLKQQKMVAKQAHYEKIIHNVFRLLHATPGINYAEALNEVENSWLYASDEVLCDCYEMLELHKKISDTQAPLESLRESEELREEFNQCLRKLFSTMRKDLGFGNNKNHNKWPTEKVELFPLGVISENIIMYKKVKNA